MQEQKVVVSGGRLRVPGQHESHLRARGLTALARPALPDRGGRGDGRAFRCRRRVAALPARIRAPGEHGAGCGRRRRPPAGRDALGDDPDGPHQRPRAAGARDDRQRPLGDAVRQVRLRRPRRAACCRSSGWYEWTGERRRKTRWAIRAPGGPILALAAVWDRWRAPGGAEVASLATVTCPPSAEVAAVHDRMPVILAPERLAGVARRGRGRCGGAAAAGAGGRADGGAGGGIGMSEGPRAFADLSWPAACLPRLCGKNRVARGLAFAGHCFGRTTGVGKQCRSHRQGTAR